MNQRMVIGAVGVFILVILGMFAYSYMKKGEMANSTPEPEVLEEETTEALRIDAKHFFRDGTHTLVGEILMPTPCDLLEADALVRESFPEQVTVAFTVVNNSEMCAQVVTPQRFKVEFSASENATIDATYEGRAAILNLIPAGPNENPDDFEIFIKG